MCFHCVTRGRQLANRPLASVPSCTWLSCASSTWSSPPWTGPLSAGKRQPSVTWRTRRSSRKCRLRDLRYLLDVSILLRPREARPFCKRCPSIHAYAFIWLCITHPPPVKVPPLPPSSFLSSPTLFHYLPIHSMYHLHLSVASSICHHQSIHHPPPRDSCSLRSFFSSSFFLQT